MLTKQLAQGFKNAFGVEKRLRIGEVYLYESRGCVLHKKRPILSVYYCVILQETRTREGWKLNPSSNDPVTDSELLLVIQHRKMMVGLFQDSS